MKYQTCQNSIKMLWKKDKTESTLTAFQILQNYINGSPATIFVDFVIWFYFFQELLKHTFNILLVLKDNII